MDKQVVKDMLAERWLNDDSYYSSIYSSLADSMTRAWLNTSFDVYRVLKKFCENDFAFVTPEDLSHVVLLPIATYSQKIFEAVDRLKHDEYVEIDWYDMEKYNSKQDLYNRMQELRKSEKNEVYWFVLKRYGILNFYYKVSTTRLSVDSTYRDVDNSWHSHPDVTEEEFKKHIFERYNKEDRELVSGIEEMSGNKFSSWDLFYFAESLHKEDLVSLSTWVLKVEPARAEKDSIFMELHLYLSELRNDSNLEDILKFWYRLVDKFKEILIKLWYNKITEDNYLEFLEKIWLPYEFYSSEEFGSILYTEENEKWIDSIEKLRERLYVLSFSNSFYDYVWSKKWIFDFISKVENIEWVYQLRDYLNEMVLVVDNADVDIEEIESNIIKILDNIKADQD